jgi:isopentenyl-diphosphate delta-isomerase
MENEICPILLALVEGDPMINPDEVEAVRWVDWNEFLHDMEHDPGGYSEWCVEEARILARSPQCRQLVGSG